MTPLAEVLAKLEPIQQRAVQLVHFEGRSYAEAARVLHVERAVIAAAMVVALRRVARHLRAEPLGGATTSPIRLTKTPPER